MIRGISLGKFLFGASELVATDLVVPRGKIEREPRLVGIPLMERTVHAAHGVIVIVVGRIDSLPAPQMVEEVGVAFFVRQFVGEGYGEVIPESGSSEVEEEKSTKS